MEEEKSNNSKIEITKFQLVTHIISILSLIISTTALIVRLLK